MGAMFDMIDCVEYMKSHMDDIIGFVNSRFAESKTHVKESILGEIIFDFDLDPCEDTSVTVCEYICHHDWIVSAIEELLADISVDIVENGIISFFKQKLGVHVYGVTLDRLTDGNEFDEVYSRSTAEKFSDYRYVIEDFAGLADMTIRDVLSGAE